MPRATIYLLCFVEGAVLIAIELLSGQMLAPLYGSSLFAWAAVIGVVVTSMALGYFTSMALVSKRTKRVIRVVLFAVAAYLFALVLSVNYFETAIYNTTRVFFSLFLTVFILAAIPAYLLAMLPALLIQELSVYVKQAGKASARIFFISTLGAICSCFLTGFFLLPAIGILNTLKVVCVILVWFAFMISVRRKILAGICILASALIFFAFPKKTAKSKWVKVLEKSEGMHGQLMVVDAPRGLSVSSNYSRIMFVNRMGQAFVDKRTGDPLWSYVDYVVYLCGSKGRAPKILVLGLGGGTVAGRLIRNLGAEVDVVEFDPRIAKAAEKYFALDKRTHVTIDDARHYLNTCSNKYDFILFDLFKGEVPPTHVLTVEALEKARSLLNENGICIINYSGFLNGSLGRDTRAVIKTVAHVFGEDSCKVIFTPEPESTRNSLIIGLTGKADPDKSSVNLMAYGKAVLYKENRIDIRTIDLAADPVLTDNKPVLEYLHLQAGLAWRKDFYTNFTRLYLKQGIPLFD